ncbi:MAG: TraR/DksA family transcriptional regulator [Saprospiraceae bacterium]|nr:TraR/DksA family transcriptional regulator [Saprospiraceae bacterium]
MSEISGTARYPDEELAEFKTLIETKLENSREQLQQLQEQIWEITENTGDEHGGDWMDDSSINNEVEMLNTMAIRQRKYIKDLENALVRIKNKTYGICIVTGELIDKRRLLAVPTTTKSVLAKNEEQKQTEEKTVNKINKTPYIQKTESETPAPATPKIITKVIKKSSTNASAAKSTVKDEEDIDFDREFNDIDFDYDKEDDIADNDDIDFDTFSDEDKMSDDY